MSTTNSRLLLAISKTIKDINREIINPEIEELEIADLKPVIEMVAKARAKYLSEVFTMAGTLGENPPTTEQLKRLQHLRVSFEELSKGAQALETAIERGYLDVEGHTPQ